MAWSRPGKPRRVLLAPEISPPRPSPALGYLQEADGNRIILVGVVHGDPAGFPRALKLLHHFRPRVVTVEISPFSLAYRRRWGPRWRRQLRAALQSLPPESRQHLALRRLAAQIAWPFEVAAATVYAQQTGTPWLPVDLNGLARRHLPLYAAELLTEANLQTLAATPDGDWEAYFQQEYRRATQALASAPEARRCLLPDLRPPFSRLREKMLAARLRRLFRSTGRLVHLGGWEHLLSGQLWPTLATYLASWQPLRLLLPEADLLPQEG